MRAEDLSFQKYEIGASYIVVTKTRKSGLHQKSRLQLPKMFETQSERCLVKLFQKYLSKHPVEMENSGPFYLQPTVNPLKYICIKRHRLESTVSILPGKRFSKKNTCKKFKTTSSPKI